MMSISETRKKKSSIKVKGVAGNKPLEKKPFFTKEEKSGSVGIREGIKELNSTHHNKRSKF